MAAFQGGLASSIDKTDGPEALRHTPRFSIPSENDKPLPTVDIQTGHTGLWDWPVKVLIVISTVLIVAGALSSAAFWTSRRVYFGDGLHISFWFLTTIYGAIMYAALAWRIWLWWRYKPMPSVSDEELPQVSVIIPAYNEGALVRQSILSAAGSQYPREKLEILVIDDGSTDDTWSYIESTVAEIEDRVNIRAFKQPRNMGKRAALHSGFRRASGSVFVTMDSDSIFTPDALRNAVTPVVRDSRIGCVAGCVEVLNPYASLWTRFLKVTFALSFKFVRAYQNEFRGVFCTPGALSVYRADVVRKVADEWLNQHFLGLPCMTGEDRAMTNLFLREGYLTAYQQNAKVYAEMPTNYVGMCKMFLRWARSNIRETLILQRFLFTPFRKEHLAAFRINMLLVLSTLIVPYLLIGNSLSLIAMHPEYAWRHFGLVALFGATMTLICYRCEKDSDALWLLFYELFWVLGCVWIMPYAAMTLKNTKWLTRGADQTAVRPRLHGPLPLPSPIESGLAPATASVAVAAASVAAAASTLAEIGAKSVT